MKSKILLLSIILFFACKKKKSVELEIIEDTNKVDVKKVLVKKEFYQLPNHLIMLTKVNEEWVVFKPCNAENGELKISENKIVWLEGHEAEELHIKKVKDELDSYKLDVESLGEFYSNGIEIYGDKNWEFFTIRNKLYGGDKTRVFVAKEKVNNYQVIEQPCKECWDDCD